MIINDDAHIEDYEDGGKVTNCGLIFQSPISRYLTANIGLETGKITNIPHNLKLCEKCLEKERLRSSENNNRSIY